MILLFLLCSESINTKILNSEPKQNELEEKLNKQEISDFIGEPRFNTSCDSDSLDSAASCEDWLLIVYLFFNHSNRGKMI